MNRKSILPIPEPILQLQRQLDQFRSTQPRRTKLPEPLWQAAVELARQHGVYPVAHPLRLDYMRLKKRLGGVLSRRRKAHKPAFVELVAPHYCVERFLHEPYALHLVLSGVVYHVLHQYPPDTVAL